MSRRQRYNPTASGGVIGERSSLGDNHIVKGINQINKWAGMTANQMVKFDFSRDQVVPWIFPDDSVAKLKAVKDMIDVRSTGGSFQFGPRYGDAEISLCIDFDENHPIPCPVSEVFRVNEDRAGPLLACVAQIKEIHERFEVVKHVLRWMNRNTTPGAIRYYFPAAMTLCPESPALVELQHTPVRFSTPPGIAEQLPLIREAAATVATACLLPGDATSRKRNNIWLNFSDYTFKGTPSVTVKTDQVIYFL